MIIFVRDMGRINLKKKKCIKWKKSQKYKTLGLCPLQLIVLKIVHNFDTKRIHF